MVKKNQIQTFQKNRNPKKKVEINQRKGKDLHQEIEEKKILENQEKDPKEEANTILEKGVLREEVDQNPIESIEVDQDHMTERQIQGGTEDLGLTIGQRDQEADHLTEMKNLIEEDLLIKRIEGDPKSQEDPILKNQGIEKSIQRVLKTK